MFTRDKPWKMFLVMDFITLGDYWFQLLQMATLLHGLWVTQGTRIRWKLILHIFSINHLYTCFCTGNESWILNTQVVVLKYLLSGAKLWIILYYGLGTYLITHKKKFRLSLQMVMLKMSFYRGHMFLCHQTKFHAKCRLRWQRLHKSFEFTK